MRPCLLTTLLAVALSSAVPSAVAAPGAGTPTLASQLETVMIVPVDGEVRFDEAGAVTGLQLDTPLPDDLRAKLDARVRGWRFEPFLIDGTPRKVRAGMRIVLAASADDDGEGYRVRVDNVTFADRERATYGPAGKTITSRDLGPPRYPAKVLRIAELKARVLLGIRVGADGRVADVVPVQSSLYDLKGRPNVVAPYLLEFERSAVKAARDWTFDVPADAATRTPAELTVMVPVVYGGPPARPLKDGAWRYTIRSPKRPLPWAPVEAGAMQVGTEDLPANAVVPLAGAPRLLTDERGRAL